jgi:hypothetical protein
VSSVLDVAGLGRRYGGAGGHHAIDRLDFAVEPDDESPDGIRGFGLLETRVG